MYDINQIFKSLVDRIDSMKRVDYYEYYNGKIYAFGDNRLPQLVIGELNNDVDEFLKNSIFIINGDKFFKYDPKKVDKDSKVILIKEIIYDPDSNKITFSRGYNELSFDYNPSNSDAYEILCNEKPFAYFNTPLIENSEFDEDFLKELINTSDFNTNIILSIDDQKAYIEENVELSEDESYIKFFIHNKYFIGNKSTTKKIKGESVTIYNRGYFSLYDLDEKCEYAKDKKYDNTYLLEVCFIEKYVEIKQYFIILDFYNER